MEAITAVVHTHNALGIETRTVGQMSFTDYQFVRFGQNLKKVEGLLTEKATLIQSITYGGGLGAEYDSRTKDLAVGEYASIEVLESVLKSIESN